jgi:hypothetical protein
MRAEDDLVLDDGLGQRAWDLTYHLVLAADSLDSFAHVDAYMRLMGEEKKRGALFVYYLTMHRLTNGFSKKLSAGEIHDVASSLFPEISALIKVGVSKVEDLLLTYCDLATPKQEVGGSDAVLIGSAVLGVILENPTSDLETMRPDLAEWFAKVRRSVSL